MRTDVSDSVIEATGLARDYGGQRAVDGVDLHVRAGTIVGVIGPSGCGKSTLVRLLIGIERPSAGTVRLFGVDPAGADARVRSRFGYMPQMPVLFPHLSASANLRFLASVYGVPWRGRRRRFDDLLDLVDLGGHRGKAVAALSGGMQRRLTLAATLVHDPELLVLDEPTAGVDPLLRERFWQHFRALRDDGRTLVVPTQYVNEAVSCDLVAVMVHGRVVAVAPPDQLESLAYDGQPVLVRLHRGWIGGETITKIEAARGVRGVHGSDDGLVVVVEDDRARHELPSLLARLGLEDAEVETLVPSYDEMFVRLVERARPPAAAVAA